MRPCCYVGQNRQKPANLTTCEQGITVTVTITREISSTGSCTASTGHTQPVPDGCVWTVVSMRSIGNI
jgi:hypothetical protein